MTVDGVNPVPVTVTVVAALPASTVEGAIELIIGVIGGGGAEVEAPEPEQPETRHNKDTQIAAIHSPNLFGMQADSSVWVRRVQQIFRMRILIG
jgi:hypothetical protein